MQSSWQDQEMKGEQAEDDIDLLACGQVSKTKESKGRPDLTIPVCTTDSEQGRFSLSLIGYGF
jgi:hypothetical protein